MRRQAIGVPVGLGVIGREPRRVAALRDAAQLGIVNRGPTGVAALRDAAQLGIVNRGPTGVAALRDAAQLGIVNRGPTGVAALENSKQSVDESLRSTSSETVRVEEPTTPYPMLGMFTDWPVLSALDQVNARIDDPGGRITAAWALVDAVAKAIIFRVAPSKRRSRYRDIEAVTVALKALGCHPRDALGAARETGSFVLTRAKLVASARRQQSDAHGHWPDAPPPSLEVAEAIALDALVLAEELSRLFFDHLARGGR